MDAWNGFVSGELRRQFLGPSVEFSGVLLCPPIATFALRIEFAALVVKAVGELVPDDGADGAVIDGGIDLWIKHRGLQESSGKDNVAKTSIVGVVGLGG